MPELNAFLGLSQDTRLYLLGSLTQNLSESATEGEVGVHLDITLKPILRRRLREADWERNQPRRARPEDALVMVSRLPGATRR